jgi:hypothetical protein
MKIAIIGSQCTGKTTYINDFISHWNMYKLCKQPRYSDLIKARGLSINEEGNEASQRLILNSLTDQVVYTPKDDNTIFDRSVLDNLVYTMWLNAHGKVSDEFVKETIKLVKETLTFYDILFFLPITKHSPVPFEEGTNRSACPTYRAEIDNLFKALVNQYNKADKTYFPIDNKLGCPAIIEIFGDRESRLELTKMYIPPDGTAFSEEDNLLIDTTTTEIDIEKPFIQDFK